MEIITDIYSFNAVPCAATIGSFDGVHLGHRSMLEELRVRAAQQGLPLMVITFAKHPRVVFGSVDEPFLLSSNEEKVALLESLGVDYCVMLDFDSDMAAMTAECFMNDILAQRLGVRVLCVGYDHHFGKPQPGEGFDEYVGYGKRCGIELFKASPFLVGEYAVSSSKVRHALSVGDIPLAKTMLGRDYSFAGSVVHGAGVGRSLGFPTANVLLHDNMKMLPADGVYDVRVCCNGEHYKGVMNIGVKPTFGNGFARTVEVFIIGFSGDVYGEDIVVFPQRRLRGEQNFASVDALRRQIETDVECVERGV